MEQTLIDRNACTLLQKKCCGNIYIALIAHKNKYSIPNWNYLTKKRHLKHFMKICKFQGSNLVIKMHHTLELSCIIVHLYKQKIRLKYSVLQKSWNNCCISMTEQCGNTICAYHSQGDMKNIINKALSCNVCIKYSIKFDIQGCYQHVL